MDTLHLVPDSDRCPSQIDLMRLHVDALYTHDEHSRIESVNQWDGGIAPRFFLGRTPAGNLWRFRADLPADLMASLDELCRDEPTVEECASVPVFEAEYVRLLSSHAPVERVWAGPAYWLSRDRAPEGEPVAITQDNANMLRGGLEEWLADVPHRQPFMAVIEESRAVSLCASVRITDAAHEAGVETLPAYRRRGHAASVVAGWARAVRKRGAIPLYSTSWDNGASQGVAERIGFVRFGTDFHVS